MKKNDKITESKEFKDCMKSAERLAIEKFKQALIERGRPVRDERGVAGVDIYMVSISDILSVANKMTREVK